MKRCEIFRRYLSKIAASILVIAMMISANHGIIYASAGTSDETEWYASDTPFDGDGTTTYLPIILGGSSPSPIIPESTRVLPEAVVEGVAKGPDQDTTVLISTTNPSLNDLAIGDVVVSDVSETLPYGFMGKIQSIHQDGQQLAVTTAPTSLTDAIETGQIQFSQQLTPNHITKSSYLPGVHMVSTASTPTEKTFVVDLNNTVLFDQDGSPATTNDQLIADGRIAVDVSYDFNLEIQSFQIKHFDFRVDVVDMSELDISSKVSFSGKEEVTLLEHQFQPIRFKVKFVPVVVVPVLTLKAGVDGSVHVGVSTSVTQNATVRGGIHYYNGSWNEERSFHNSFSYKSPALDSSMLLQAYAGPELALLFYGVAGVDAEVNAYLELDAKQNNDPWWVLYGGLQASVGIQERVLLNLEYELVIADYREKLAEAPARPQSINLMDRAAVAHWSSGAGTLPFPGSDVDPRGFAVLRTNYLLEDGNRYAILETHPQWIEDGYILGRFPIATVRSGQRFMSKVGFIQPGGSPATDGVWFRIRFNNIILYEGFKAYTGHLAPLNVSLAQFEGQSGTLSLEVLAYGTASQDWFSWVEPQIATPADATIDASGLDLISAAPLAHWFSGAGTLPFPGSDVDERGFAIYRRNLVLENGVVYPILETHPQWTDSGYLVGEYHVPAIAAGQHFRSRVGFIMPVSAPATNGVLYVIRFNGTEIYRSTKYYTGSLHTVDINLERYAGQSGRLTLEVYANGTAAQDWFSWVNPRISYR